MSGLGKVQIHFVGDLHQPVTDRWTKLIADFPSHGYVLFHALGTLVDCACLMYFPSLASDGVLLQPLAAGVMSNAWHGSTH